MTLDYVALAILIAVALILFYGVIVIHDIPYEIAKERRHPHQDAIHYAGWVSLFTLHALWPLLWIWALFYCFMPRYVRPLVIRRKVKIRISLC